MTKNISEYTKEETRKAYEGIKLALTINAGQPTVISFMIQSMEEVKARAAELGMEL